ncbi:hypothetical protein BGZ82_007137 [Podila clonocystis]|nr:hypothetical protein BGZ82_007137 [Podila clonocystis]
MSQQKQQQQPLQQQQQPLQQQQQQQQQQQARQPVPPPRQQHASASSSNRQASSSQATDDEIPTIVLQEQMETMLIEYATTESRVRELVEELDTIQSHPVFSSMILAWFLSFNPGDYSIHRLDDLKRDALNAWTPVLASFLDNSNSDGVGSTTVEARLFDSIVQDVISHANIIAGSTLPPEELIQNLIHVAQTELENTRKTLVDKSNDLQDLQLKLQSRGAVLPSSVLEMQRQMEQEQQQVQEAKRAKEQRQREEAEQKRKKEMEERQKRQLKKQQEQRERERQLQEEENRRNEEALRKQRQEEAMRRQELSSRPGGSLGSAVQMASHQGQGHLSGRPKAASVSAGNTLPSYGMHITEEETVMSDIAPRPQVGAVNPISYIPATSYTPGRVEVDHGEEVPSTPLIRRSRPLPALPEVEQAENTAMLNVHHNHHGHHHHYQPVPTPVLQPMTIPVPGQVKMPMPQPFVSDYGHQEYNSHNHIHGQNFRHDHHQPVEPAMYPPQIISEQDLQERLAKEQLEQIKKRNEAMERELLKNQEVHALAMKTMELQGSTLPQVYNVHSAQIHPGPGMHGHDLSPEAFHDQSLAHNHAQSPNNYPPHSHSHSYQQYTNNQGYPQQQFGQNQQQGFQQQSFQQQQQGYQGYNGEYVQDTNGAYSGATGIMNGQDASYHQGGNDNYGYQYSSYSNNTMGNWSHSQQQQFMHQHQQQQQHQQQHVYPSPPNHVHQQQQQQQQLQHDGYIDRRLQRVRSVVTYSTSPHGREYDFGPVEGEPSSTSSPTSEVSSTSTPNQGEEPVEILPQIRANPIKVHNRRAPQAILTEEQKEAAANALSEMNREEEDEPEQAEQPEDQNPEAEETSEPVEPTPQAVKCVEEQGKEVEAESPHEAQTPPQEEPSLEQQRADEDDEEEEEEEVLHRSVRKLVVSSSPNPVRAPSPGGQRTNPVFSPFPNPRPAPRPAPRPVPRPISVLVKPSVESLKASSPSPVPEHAEVEYTNSPTRSSQASPVPSTSSQESKRLSRTPSLPPVVPKKPLALRSSRTPVLENRSID